MRFVTFRAQNSKYVVASFELLILKKSFLLIEFQLRSILVRHGEYDGGECQVYNDGVGNI